MLLLLSFDILLQLGSFLSQALKQGFLFVHLRHRTLPLPLNLRNLSDESSALFIGALFTVACNVTESIELELGLGQLVLLQDVSVTAACFGDVGSSS